MSTRSTTHFIDSWGAKVIIYVHHDGYPSCRGRQIKEFLDIIMELKDPRTSEACVLSARFVAYMIGEYVKGSTYYKHPLDPISVKIVWGDPNDIQYRYVVDCGNLDDDGRPKVTCDDLSDREPLPLEEVLA